MITSCKIKLLVADVDGTMTDGGIYYDENANELKKFCTRDAAGYFTAHQVGMQIMVLTGRECKATTRRMSEMKIDFIYQNVKDKYSFLKQFMEKNNYQKSEVAYIGDDLNDYYAMSLAGTKGCPLDAYEEIKSISDYVATKPGGAGAVRDFIEYILKQEGKWKDAFYSAYGIPSEYKPEIKNERN